MVYKIYCLCKSPPCRTRDVIVLGYLHPLRGTRLRLGSGRRRWKKEAGSHLQARVENAFFRYKSILGDRLRARSRGGRVAESVVACNVLNQMTELGRPESYSIGRCLASGLGSLTVSFECRVAPGDCSPEALTRTGLGGFHHPALPLMWLMAMRPRFARESEARAEDIVPTTQRTSARGPLPFECLVT